MAINSSRSPKSGGCIFGFCFCFFGFAFGVSLTLLSMNMPSMMLASETARVSYDALNANLFASASSGPVVGGTVSVMPNVAPVVPEGVSEVGNSGQSKNTDEQKNPNPYNWPGIPKQELGIPLVKIGHNFVDNAREILLEHWDEFLAVYADRPDKVNLCGIRINHAYALWITVKHLKPTSIIESGVNAGQSTYFMRNASATAKIYAIDPEEKPICNQGKRWEDPTKNGFYYTGKQNFQDIEDIRWIKYIRKKVIQPNTTLVFLDDHMKVFPRFGMFLQLGFRHIMLEDNYKIGEGATVGDKADSTPKQMFNRIDKNTDFLFHQLISYTEFPPLVPPIMAKASTTARKQAGGFMVATDTNTDIMAPILRPDLDDQDKARYEEMCKRFGLDPTLADDTSYMQLMNYNQICYMELRPLSPLLARKWKNAVRQDA